MRTLGLDVGTRRLGVAVSDEMGWTAQPFVVVEAKTPEDMVEKLKGEVAHFELDKAVVGLPRNMDGSEGSSCEMARKVGALIESEMGLDVEYWDERLTTVAAERALLEADMSRKKRKKVIDKVAASMILQGWLDGQSR